MITLKELVSYIAGGIVFFLLTHFMHSPAERDVARDVVSSILFMIFQFILIRLFTKKLRK